MQYVLGIESGTSGTTAVVADANGRLLGIGHNGAPLHLGDHETAERTRRYIGETIRAAINMADLENARIACGCLALPGAASESAGWIAAVVPAESVRLVPIALAALEATTLGAHGAAVVLQRGLQVVARGPLQSNVTVGGREGLWPESGGGAWIAYQALQACSEAEDGLASPTEILPLLLQYFEVSSPAGLAAALTPDGLLASRISAFGEIVTRAAASGDLVARRILREAGGELAGMVAAAIGRAGLTATAVPVGIVGDGFRAGRFLLRSLRGRLRRTAPLAEIAPPEAPLAVGAALLALEALAISPCAARRAATLQSLPRIRG